MWGGKDQGKGDQVDKYDEKKTQNNLWHIFAFGMFYLGWLLRSSDFVQCTCSKWLLQFVDSSLFCGQFHILWTIPHFVDNSTFCRQFHILWTIPRLVDNFTFCGQFNILIRGGTDGGRGDGGGTEGAKGGTKGPRGLRGRPKEGPSGMIWYVMTWYK